MLDKHVRSYGFFSVFVLSLVLSPVVSSAAPIVPTIDGPCIGFAAEMRYETLGTQADMLSTKDAFGDELLNKYEAGSFWPNYPALSPAKPLWYEESGVRYYAADVQLAVKFTGADPVSMPGFPSVSLLGTGAGAEAQMVNDLEIWGTTDVPGQPTSGNELLWSMELDSVSLYGYAGDTTFVLEGTGTILGGSLAEAQGEVGSAGVIRGHIDLTGLIGEDYHPVLVDVFESGLASYAGETGVVPEPVSMVMLAVGGLGVLVRRRR